MCSLFHSPTFPPGLSVHECVPAGSSNCRHAMSPLCPGCPSPPLLPVWMNVSSLSPWLSDFHTVRFSVSSGCFLFLNCCPSFGCARRHSVSTYTSILARSPDIHVFFTKNYKAFFLPLDGVLTKSKKNSAPNWQLFQTRDQRT